jgi:hypothetical protein
LGQAQNGGGVKLYYDYAHKKAEVVAELRQELFGGVVDIVYDETDVEMY